MDIQVYRDTEALAHGAADIVEVEVADADTLMLGIAGGSTPVATHHELALRSIDWSGVTGWIPDERWTPAGAEDANQRMAAETLTDPCGVRLLAPDTSTTPPVAALSYGDLVIPRLTDPDSRSVVMLGMGTDGHTASLFPGTAALENEEIAYVANFVPQLDTWRLTATFALLATADRILFLVAGEAKAERLKEIQTGVDHPAGRITARHGVTWLVDEAAASRLGF